MWLKSLWVIHGGLSPRWNHIRLRLLHFLLVAMQEGADLSLLYFHSEDEIASESLIGQDQHPDVSLTERIARLEQVVEQTVGLPLPQIMEDRVDGVQAFHRSSCRTVSASRSGPCPSPRSREEVSERTQHAHFGRESFEKDGRQHFDCENPKDVGMYPPLTSIDQQGGQTCRDPADSKHRQDRRQACGVQRQVPRIRIARKTVKVPINQVTKLANIMQTLHLDKVGNTLVVMARQVLSFRRC